VTINIGAGESGAKGARIRFGYEENEPNRAVTQPRTMHFYCTQYHENCYYQAGNYSNTKAANATNLPLGSSQTLRIGVPQRVLFYQVEYLDGSKSMATGPMQMLAITLVRCVREHVQPAPKHIRSKTESNP